jgi:5-methylthioadenosine/S-adenosylhomocysteine deaminase
MMNNPLVIENTTILTMNETREVKENSSIAVIGNQIAAIGSVEEIRASFPEGRFMDGKGKVVMPGLINCHTHIAMSLQKGITMAVPDGLYRVMWPVEKALTPEDIYAGALIGGAEALLGGSTTVVDHYFHMEEITRATLQLGLRGALGHTIMSRLGPVTGEKELREGIDFARRWKGKHELVIPMLAPHASDTVAQEWLKELRETATSEGFRLHLHLAQSQRELDYIREQHNLGCVEYLEDIGFLGEDVLAAHCIHIDDREMDILARSGAHPVYCPMGHSLGGKPMRTWELLERGTGVLIGTDCVTSNNVMDLTGELRIAGAAQKQLTGDRTAMPGMKILEMVTVDAAKAIGMEGKLGSLAPGYLADLVVLDISGLHAAPNYSLVDNIIYSCTGRDVETVIVNGQVVVEQGKLLTADEEELVELAERYGRKLMKRAVEKDPELNFLWMKNCKFCKTAEE